MAEYLDPRSEIVFKKIFMDHPLILRSFLNAVLPFETEQEQIVEIAVLPPEQPPDLHVLKDSYVDVKCRDGNGRQFIVEMQMIWTQAFMHRVLYNASKAYSRQLEKGQKYEDLKPVYGLSVLDDVFPASKKMSGGVRELRMERQVGKYYHHYRLADVQEPHRIIDQLQLIFVELPAFKKADPRGAHRLHWAWLRFLSEASDVGTEGGLNKETFEKEVLVSPEIVEAAEIARISGYTRAQLDAYESFWDRVSRERTLMSGSFKEGQAEGLKREQAALQLAETERARAEEALKRADEAQREAEDAVTRESVARTELQKLREAMRKAGLDPDAV
jgi:predicted transposase/invertase (TIGR01784 family)